MLITISRQYSAGGSVIASRVSETLNWTLVDNQLVDEVARRAGVPPKVVAEHEERAPGFLERLTRTLANATGEYVDPEGGLVPELEETRLVRITESVVAEFATSGKVVMVGRAAPAVLSNTGNCLHVKIVAPRAVRIARTMARLGVEEKAAARKLEEMDHARERYHREYYERDWNDPGNYHMVLNSDALTLDGAADVILDRAARLGWR